MIYIKELTVGCQVTLNGKPYKVDEVVPWSIGIEGKESLYYPKDIDPIPITKELLLKNGFEFIKYRNLEQYSKGFGEFNLRFDYKMSNTPNRDWHLQIVIEERCSIGGCDVQYIHQVQTMCHVLGIELIFEV